MKMLIVVPKPKKELFLEVFRRTDNYIKTSEILRVEYGVKIELKTEDEVKRLISSLSKEDEGYAFFA